MQVAGGPQFIVGRMLQGEQRIVGAGHRLQDLIEFALSCGLLAGLRVLDHEDHGQSQRGDQRLDDAAPYCTPSYVEMEAGASLVRLGRPYACAGEAEAACATAGKVLASARDLTSAPVFAELARLRQHLTPWADQQPVAGLRARLAATISPDISAVRARKEGAP